MKKKFIIAALLAGVMAASCFTGCIGNGNCEGENGEQGQQQGSVEKGVEVTAEEWTAAINASMNSQNFTMSGERSYAITVTGYYKGNDKIPVNILGEDKQDEYEYFDSNNNLFEHSIEKFLVSGFADIYSHKDLDAEWLESLKDFLSSYGIYSTEDKEENRTMTAYGVKIDKKYYVVDKETYKDEESAWGVAERDFGGVTLGDMLPLFYTEENSEEKPLAELYEAFTYSDGVYTAELWFERTFTISISFKDGHILSVDIKATESNAEEKDGLTVTYIAEMIHKYYDIGKTSVTPAPEEALKAVEDYIEKGDGDPILMPLP